MERTPEPPQQGGSGASGPAVRLRLDVAYDGGTFRGFAENAGVRTVAGELRAALETVLRQPVQLTCAGRTDAGVHAWGQVVSLDAHGPPDPVALRDSLNALVGPAVVVRGVQQVPADFDARFSARWRRYRYLIWNDPVPHPFLHDRSWWVREPLDGAAISAAARLLHGEHDFSSFCRRPAQDPPASLVRRVLHTAWVEQPDASRCFEIAATAFCHQMVRSIVGALVVVGRGRMPAEEVGVILARRDRSGTPNLAPPQGLVLHEVGYRPWSDPPGPIGALAP